MSNAFKKFLNTYRHYQGAIQLGMDVIDSGGLPKESAKRIFDTSSRMAFVGAVAAFDRYFTDRFLEALLPYLKNYKAGKDFANFLSECGVDIHATLELIRMKRPGSRLKLLVRKKLEFYVTQNPDKIDKLYSYYGIKDLLENAEKLKKRKTLARNTFSIIQLRHRIVHDGDCTKNGEVRDLSYKNAGQYIRKMGDLMTLVHGCEEIITNKGI